MVAAFNAVKMYKLIMPKYRFGCDCDFIHEITLSYNDYKAEMICPSCGGTMTRIYSDFVSKEGRTLQQKKLGATEKRLEGGKFMKSETDKRKADAPPDARENVSNEYWLGNEFKNGTRSLKDF
jgi:hypothetical protein